jgi:uncharacterized protein YrrD
MDQQPLRTYAGFPPEASSGPGSPAEAGGTTLPPAAARATQLRGRPVRSARTGESLGHVSQVLLDLSRRAIAGFRLRHGGLLDRRWRLAAFDDVVAVTATAVLLPDRLALREDVRAPAVVVAHRWMPTVCAADGRPLGQVQDLRCDLRTGRIDAFEVRLIAGRPAMRAAWFPADLVVQWGPEVLVLSIDHHAALRLVTIPMEHDV